MRRVYTAATLPEAHLIQQLLESAAINARVFNENAQGAIGELPVTDAWPDVWIVQNHQFHAARAVIGCVVRSPQAVLKYAGSVKQSCRHRLEGMSEPDSIGHFNFAGCPPVCQARLSRRKRFNIVKSGHPRSDWPVWGSNIHDNGRTPTY